ARAGLDRRRGGSLRRMRGRFARSGFGPNRGSFSLAGRTRAREATGRAARGARGAESGTQARTLDRPAALRGPRRARAPPREGIVGARRVETSSRAPELLAA